MWQRARKFGQQFANQIRRRHPTGLLTLIPRHKVPPVNQLDGAVQTSHGAASGAAAHRANPVLQVKSDRLEKPAADPNNSYILLLHCEHRSDRRRKD